MIALNSHQGGEVAMGIVRKILEALRLVRREEDDEIPFHRDWPPVMPELRAQIDEIWDDLKESDRTLNPPQAN